MPEAPPATVTRRARSPRRPGSGGGTAPSAAELWLLAQQAGDHSRPAAAVRFCQRALRRVPTDPTATTEVHAQILVTLACYQSELGHPDLALTLLDEALRTDRGSEAAVLTARGMVLLRSGDADAIAALDRAIQALTGVTAQTARPGAGPSDLAAALLNRGVLHMSAGRLRAAFQDTQAAEDAAREAGRPGVVVMARHNLGYVTFLTGDLPGALHAMAEAAAVAPETTHGVQSLDRARVLLAAGLLTEAAEFADDALAAFRKNRAMPDLAEACLVRSEIHLMSRQPSAARSMARRAARIYAGRGNTTATLTARLLQVRAESQLRQRATPRGGGALRRRAAAAADTAATVATALALAGLRDQAGVAGLFEAEALLDADDPDGAARALAAVGTAGPAAPLATRLHTRLVSGRIALTAGRRSAGLAEIRRGLDDLARFQARFGSQDLQSAAAIHGRELARLGLGAAVSTGSPAAILQWLERSRAASSWLPAVRPPADPVLAEELGALRMADEQARAALLAGRRDPVADQRVTELRRRVRARSWVAGGSGVATRPLPLAAVQRLLRAAGSQPSVVAPFAGGGRFHALVITGTSARYVPLGGDLDLDVQLQRLINDLNVLADHRILPALRRVAAGSLRAGLERLAGAIVEPLQPFVDDGPLVVAAAGGAAIVPWALVPGLTGRAVSVSSSVTAAVAHLGTPDRAHQHGVLAVAGPDLPEGLKEVQSVAAAHADAAVLTGPAATGRAVLAAIPAGGLLHIAAHGHHEPDNPLFSGVLLADGLLYGYDVAPNPTLPAQVVLSSCDVGSTDDRPGGEPLGLVAALLRSGVSTVIAGTSRVSDEIAAAVMTSYHQLLVAGRPPAVALADAIGAVADTDTDPAPFTCFGGGL